MRVYYDRDADLARLLDKKIVIVGYGSRGTPTPSTCAIPVSSKWPCPPSRGRS